MCATQGLPMRVSPFAFRYQGDGASPCQYIDTTRKAIDCAIALKLRNFAADFYYRNCPKDDKFRYFIPILRKLGRRRTSVDGSFKARVEFLLSVIGLLFLSLTVEALQGKMCQNSLPSGGVCQFAPRFQGEEVVPLPKYS